MCTHQRGSWECRGDGYLWDADRDGYDPTECDYPCPECNTEKYLEQAKEDAESTIDGSSNGYTYTGQTIWENAVACAEKYNPRAALEALRAIGLVEACRPGTESDPDSEIVCYVYTHSHCLNLDMTTADSPPWSCPN